MTAPTPAVSPIAQAILADARRLADDVEALRPILSAFAPLFAAQAMVRENAPGWTGPLPGDCADTLFAGVSVLAKSGFADVSGQIAQAARTLLPVMEQGFPALAGQLRAVGQALATGVLSPDAVIEAAHGTAAVRLDDVDAAILAFAGRMLLRPLLARQAMDIAAHIRDIPWQRPTCPVCGGKPDFSRLLRLRDEAEYITGHGGIRFLRCATCSTEWRYKRVSCPGCGNEEPSRLTGFHTQSRPFERVDACEVCQSYCPCLNAAEFVDVPDPDISALALLPLELDARQKGYTPLANAPWATV